MKNYSFTKKNNKELFSALGVGFLIPAVTQAVEPFPANFELSSLSTNQAAGFKINGEVANDHSGFSVGGAGDINGDGFDDLIIGAFYADPNGINFAGASYVVFGQSKSFGTVLELNSLNGSNGFKINGEASYDFSGHSVSGAGDINGDGLGDLIIGAFGADPNGNNSGACYVVFGQSNSFGTVLELNSLNGSNGFKINGETLLDHSGYSVSAISDINGDGFSDLIIGAFGADPNGINLAGASYIVFGLDYTLPNITSSLTAVTTVEATNFSYTITADNGPITGFGASGLPSWASLNGNVISGTPDAAGNFLITLSATNAFGFDIKILNLTVSLNPPVTTNITNCVVKGDFTANGAPDLLTKKGKALRLLPLAVDSNHVVSVELPDGLSLPTAIAPSDNRLPKKTKLRASLDMNNAGVSDILVQEGKDKLKLFKLDNNISNTLPTTPTVLSTVDFTMPKKHRYLGVGALSGSSNGLDLVLKKGKELFVAANSSNSFSTNLQPITGKLGKGKLLSIQPDRMILQKGKKLNQQSISNLVLGTTTELGKLAKGQKPLLMLDINQNGKLDVVTLGKKGSVGFVSEDSLSATPTNIVTLPKKTKVVGPK